MLVARLFPGEASRYSQRAPQGTGHAVLASRATLLKRHNLAVPPSHMHEPHFPICDTGTLLPRWSVVRSRGDRTQKMVTDDEDGDERSRR